MYDPKGYIIESTDLRINRRGMLGALQGGTILCIYPLTGDALLRAVGVPSEICAGRLHAKRFLTPFRRLCRLVPGSPGEGETEPKQIGEGTPTGRNASFLLGSCSAILPSDQQACATR